MLVRDGRGREVLATQLAQRPGGAPLRLTRAPAGAAARAAAAARTSARAAARDPRPYAGPFRELRATGTAAARTVTARTSHRFTASHVETRWRVHRRAGGAHTVDVLFPSWGRRSASVWAVTRDGRRTRVGAGARSGARAAYFHVAGARSGYVDRPGRPHAVHASTPSGRSASRRRPTRAPRSWSASPHRTRFRTLTFAARLAPAPSAADARRIAARLHAR